MKLLLLPILMGLAACGQSGQSKTKSATAASIDCTGSDCTDASFTAVPRKTEGVLSQRQLLPNFQHCLGMPSSAVSAATTAAFNASLADFSQEGSVKDLSAPMLLSVAKVTAELCNDLIENVEKGSSQRRFFAGFTLNSPATAADGAQTFDMNKTLQTLSKACWGRTITAGEIASVTAQLAAGRKDKPAAIFACTAVLSSAQAIRN